MDEQSIQQVMDYAVCSREVAIKALNDKNNNVIEATAHIIDVPRTVCAPKQKVMSEEQSFFNAVRRQLDNLDASIRSGFTSQDQSASVESSDSQVLHVETVQQNNYSREYRPSSPELKAQIPETVCQLPSEYSCDSQLNDQK